MTAVQDGLGYEVKDDVETGCLEDINTLCKENGLEPVWSALTAYELSNC